MDCGSVFDWISGRQMNLQHIWKETNRIKIILWIGTIDGEIEWIKSKLKAFERV